MANWAACIVPASRPTFRLYFDANGVCIGKVILKQVINSSEKAVTGAFDGLLRSGFGWLARMDGYPGIKVVGRIDRSKGRVALDTGTVPGLPKQKWVGGDKAELGLGIHGEAGVEPVDFTLAPAAMGMVAEN